jgi:hypothetical protein
MELVIASFTVAVLTPVKVLPTGHLRDPGGVPDSTPFRRCAVQGTASIVVHPVVK